jgi:hypothetical protein
MSLLGHSNFKSEIKNKIQCLFWDIVILISKKRLCETKCNRNHNLIKKNQKKI